MPYQQIRGRRPYERASKIAHSEIITNPLVQEFIAGCSLPDPPSPAVIKDLLVPVPEPTRRLATVIAIDGGLTETVVRAEYPSASFAFMTMGPLLLSVDDLDDLDQQPFIGPEDMERLKKIERYSLAVPTKTVRHAGCATFAQGVRKSVQDFLGKGDGHLLEALGWLLFRGWRPEGDRVPWMIPRCPNPDCDYVEVWFADGEAAERPCPTCSQPIYLSDALRLYERIDEEAGAGAILGYLLTALEQLILVRVIKAIWTMKRAFLREVLFVKDGPLAFFGVTAPLYRPMRDLMAFLGASGDPYIRLVGLEKSGPFVEHAAAIEDAMLANHALVLTNDYIYKHVIPGDATQQEFGRNTYYGAKVIFRGERNDTYVATIPTTQYLPKPSLNELFNAAEVLRITARLRCSMYDNALVPVVLANRLVSLADVPSSEILKKFAKDRMAG
jgi:NurA domain